jgi:hypothetical protein
MEYIKQINQADVLYDVNYTTWKVAKCRIADQQMQAESQTDDENNRWFARQYETAIDNIKSRLQAYVVPTEDNSDFHFSFPEGWRGNISALMTYIHRYIVDYILYEWFKMTIPNEAATYLTSADAWEYKAVLEARNEDVSNVFFRL